MNVSIIGAGRTRNGIGEYIGKYFHQHGGKVTSVLGATEKKRLRACLCLRKKVEEIFERALQKELTIAMNSQWPFSIDAYEALCGKIMIQKWNTLFIRMSPPFPGREMIPESVPHALSLLYCLLGVGEIEDLSFESDGAKEMAIKFSYLFETQTCTVFFRFTFEETPPRHFSFGLNVKIVSRSLGLEDFE